MMLIDSGIFNLLILLLILLMIWLICMLNHFLVERRRAVKILEMLIGIIEAGNPNLDGHSLHVHNLCMLMYEFLPYPCKLTIRPGDLHYASLLLDVGKLGIPSDILQKSGKLGNYEWEIVRKHPELALDILKGVPGMERIYSYILYHHERIDGKGYHQLTGDQIPLGARIIAIADTYSAITMNRSYKAYLSYVEAVAELKTVAGTQLDERLVKAFCNIPMNKVDACLDDVRAKMERFYEDRKGAE